MELENHLLANILFILMAIGYVVLTAGLMFWLLLLGRKR
jgi:hypothetical protein